MAHILPCFFLFWALGLSQALCAQTEGLSPTHPELAKELMQMRTKDQKLRIKWASMYRDGKTDSKKYRKLTTGLLASDRANTFRLSQIIKQYGWPTYDMVGQRAANSAWLIAQHSDRNPLFQERCLELMKQAVDEGQASPRDYAYLYDRVQVAFARPQLYATQSSSNNGLWEGSFFPIAEEWNIQVRRDSMGVTLPVVDYAMKMGFEYSVPSREEAKERRLALEQRYHDETAAAYEARAEGELLRAVEHLKSATLCYGFATQHDFLQLAILVGESGSDDYYGGYASLLKAGLLGWEGFSAIESDPRFDYLKVNSPQNWKDLMDIIEHFR